MRVAILAIIDTDDPRLTPERISVETAQATAHLRQAVIDNLPRLDRIFAVMDEEAAEDLMALDRFLSAVTGDDGFHMPPDDYRPPRREP